MPAHILFLHSPDIPGHYKPRIHILCLNYQQGTEGADRAQLLGQAQWLVLAHHVPQNISARFLELANTSELPQYLFATKWGRDFLCRTGSITSLCHSLQELNPRPLDLKDHLYSVKGQADDL